MTTFHKLYVIEEQRESEDLKQSSIPNGTVFRGLIVHAHQLHGYPGIWLATQTSFVRLSDFLSVARLSDPNSIVKNFESLKSELRLVNSND